MRRCTHIIDLRRMSRMAGAERGKKKKKLNKETEVARVLPEHRYTPTADLFVS